MKIICLGNYFSTGGAQMDVVLLAELLREQGHDSEAWFFMRTGELNTGDTPYRIFADKKSRNPFAILKMLYNFFKACRAYKPDIIYGFYPFSNVMGALAKTFGLCDKFVASQRNPSDTQSPVFYHFEKWLGSSSAYQANVCTSQAVVDSFDTFPNSYKKKLSVVYCGVPPLIPVNESKQECRARFGLLGDAFIIGSLGRLHRQKNIPFIVRCMVDLPDFVLAIAGSGPDLNDIKNLAKDLEVEDRVIFVGEVANEDITKFYKAADIFAMPSIYEGFGRTLAEAMEIGVPVICSDIPVLQEVSNGAAITLPLEQSKWVHALKEIKDGKIDTIKLVKSGQERAKDFSLEAMTQGYFKAATE
jgi:glycosyltransferase involved in cell wall biosynthesis